MSSNEKKLLLECFARRNTWAVQIMRMICRKRNETNNWDIAFTFYYKFIATRSRRILKRYCLFRLPMLPWTSEPWPTDQFHCCKTLWTNSRMFVRSCLLCKPQHSSIYTNILHIYSYFVRIIVIAKDTGVDVPHDRHLNDVLLSRYLVTNFVQFHSPVSFSGYNRKGNYSSSQPETLSTHSSEFASQIFVRITQNGQFNFTFSYVPVCSGQYTHCRNGVMVFIQNQSTSSHAKNSFLSHKNIFLLFLFSLIFFSLYIDPPTGFDYMTATGNTGRYQRKQGQVLYL